MAWEITWQRFLTDIIGQMAGPALLMAMGWLLVLRNGAIDLSVWVVAAVGGMVAAAAMKAGVPPALAFCMASALGAMVGLINGLLVVLARMPSVAATLVMGLVVMWAAQGAFQDSSAELPMDAFVQDAPDQYVDSRAEEPLAKSNVLIFMRIMIVLCTYVAVMFLAVRRESIPRPGKERIALIVSLIVCGSLAGLAGACMLMDHGMASVPTRLIGDFRVPAAAILAGSLFLAGPGRAKLAGLCMPLALLVVTIWQQEVWLLGAWGYEWQLFLLTVLVVFYHLACRAIGSLPAGAPGILAKASAGAIGVGTLLLAVTPAVGQASARPALRITCLAVCITGAAALLVAYRLAGARGANDKCQI